MGKLQLPEDIQLSHKNGNPNRLTSQLAKHRESRERRLLDASLHVHRHLFWDRECFSKVLYKLPSCYIAVGTATRACDTQLRVS